MRAAVSPGDPVGLTTTRGVGRRIRPALVYLGALPFFLYVGLFLIWPTVAVVIGAFEDADGHPTLHNLAVATRSTFSSTSRLVDHPLPLSTAALGAVLGGLLGLGRGGGPPDGLLRRVVAAASGTLAQFGGVMLAFAFLATLRLQRLRRPSSSTTGWPRPLCLGVPGSTSSPGLASLYTYFQIPLMLHRLPARGRRAATAWREACDSLGGSVGAYLAACRPAHPLALVPGRRPLLFATRSLPMPPPRR